MKKFIDAFRGIGFVFKDGLSLKTQIIFTLLSVFLGVYLKINTTEWCFVVVVIGSVLAGEVFNSTIEWLCNFVEPNHHKEIGKIKDAAAGAVLVLSIAALIVGALIFIPKIMAL